MTQAKRFTFWKENKKSQEFTLTSKMLREKFSEYLKIKDRNWIEHYRTERIIRAFITDETGLNSVFNESEFESIYDTLNELVFHHLKTLKSESNKN